MWTDIVGVKGSQGRHRWQSPRPRRRPASLWALYGACCGTHLTAEKV